MKIETIDSIEVSGFCIRTTMGNEITPGQGKIPQLWESFTRKASHLLSEKSRVYGVYTNYESGITGEYDVFAVADTLTGQNLEGIQTIQIAAGKYLVFSRRGSMPQVCIDLWTDVWNYLTSPDCPHKQAFTTDFEAYKTCSMDGCELDVYIAIK